MKVKEERKTWLKIQHSKNKDHGIWSHHFMANRWGKSENNDLLIFLGSKITADSDCSNEIKSYAFSSSHVQMCELDHKEG